MTVRGAGPRHRPSVTRAGASLCANGAAVFCDRPAETCYANELVSNACRNWKEEAKMTDVCTSESAARVILDMFHSHNARPGEAVLSGALGQLTVAGLLSSDGVDDGLGYGVLKGWFENGPNGALRLTEAGFAKF